MTLKEYFWGFGAEATLPPRRWVMTLLRERATQDGHEDAVETKEFVCTARHEGPIRLIQGPRPGSPIWQLYSGCQVPRSAFAEAKSSVSFGPNGAGKTTTFRMLCGLLPGDQWLPRGGGFQPENRPSTCSRSHRLCLPEVCPVWKSVHFPRKPHVLRAPIRADRAVCPGRANAGFQLRERKHGKR